MVTVTGRGAAALGPAHRPRVPWMLSGPQAVRRLFDSPAAERLDRATNAYGSCHKRRMRSCRYVSPMESGTPASGTADTSTADAAGQRSALGRMLALAILVGVLAASGGVDLRGGDRRGAGVRVRDAAAVDGAGRGAVVVGRPAAPHRRNRRRARPPHAGGDGVRTALRIPLRRSPVDGSVGPRGGLLHPRLRPGPRTPRHPSSSWAPRSERSSRARPSRGSARRPCSWAASPRSAPSSATRS